MNHGDDEFGGQIVIAGVFWAAVAMWGTYETSDFFYHSRHTGVDKSNRANKSLKRFNKKGTY